MITITSMLKKHPDWKEGFHTHNYDEYYLKGGHSCTVSKTETIESLGLTGPVFAAMWSAVNITGTALVLSDYLDKNDD
jgi:hypothetical protein